MSNFERDYKSFVFRIEQLEQNQQVMARYMAQMKRQLDELSEQINNQPELQQNSSLQDALSQLHWQFDELKAPSEVAVKVVKLIPNMAAEVDEFQAQPSPVQSPEYQLVFDRSGSRAVLMSALEKAQKRLIIVCPWLSRNSIDADLIQKFRDCLNRNCRIDIGWGHLSDRSRIGFGWRYDALRDLREMERDYPDQFRLKLLGTHEKFLVCDSTFAMLGSHNILTSNVQSGEREVGIRTTNTHIVQGLIDRFDSAQAQEAQVIAERLAVGSVSLNGAEALEDFNTISFNPDSESDYEDSDESDEDDRSASVNATEFLRRYQENERTFKGIKLARAKLGQATLAETNLSNSDFNEANLSGANLTKTILFSATLIRADLSKANLSEALLQGANLTAANLRGANLTQTNLSSANLSGADLSKVNLRKVESLASANLSGAKLIGVNLLGLNLRGINLSGADLSQATLCSTYLGQANLSGTNLTKADIRGANLNNANLEKANLTGAQLGGTNLDRAKLSDAIMPDGTVHQ